MPVSDEIVNKILILIFDGIDIAALANQFKDELLTADEGAKYDRVIDINLSEVCKYDREILFTHSSKIFFSLNHMLMVHLHLILHIQSVN